MAEALDVEVGAELAVEAVQQVLVEGGGDAGGVVVGPKQHVRVLLEIEADQQQITVGASLAHAREQRARVVGAEVADGGAEEHDELAARRRLPRQVRDALDVLCHQAVHLEGGERRARARHQIAHGAVRDVDGHVARRVAAAQQVLEQDARLAAVAGAEIDHVERSAVTRRQRRDVGPVRRQELQLRARDVVLRLRTDAREQLAADVVVEPT